MLFIYVEDDINKGEILCVRFLSYISILQWFLFPISCVIYKDFVV